MTRDIVVQAAEPVPDHQRRALRHTCGPSIAGPTPRRPGIPQRIIHRSDNPVKPPWPTNPSGAGRQAPTSSSKTATSR